MTSFNIERLPFNKDAVSVWAEADTRHKNWPVVYTIEGTDEIYVGESTNVANRMFQHLAVEQRQHLKRIKVILDDRFNKSVCLDLESQLIRYLAADSKYKVLNGNHGITDADYFERDRYRETFNELFDELLKEGVFTRSIPDIVNSDLFKFSPFKALNTDQSVAIEGVLEKLFEDLENKTDTPIVIQGDPGTGKTIVAVYLMKLLVDIAKSAPDEQLDSDSMFSDFFQQGYREQLRDFTIGLVIPQQSLRKSIEKVFAKTPGLSKSMVLSPFDAGASKEHYDLLIVDESHRLGQRSNQPSAAQNKKFTDINTALFGNDDLSWTQLDWIKAKSTHQLYLLDSAQSVKPADLPAEVTAALVQQARSANSFFRLVSQMRVAGGTDYIEFIGRIFAGTQQGPESFGNYELRFFDDIAEMRKEIFEKDKEVGLSRMIAGYAWPWASKNDPSEVDIQIGNLGLTWNRTATDWINSPTSLEEVGSIHTVQGYDLNYAGVIIGPDLGYDPVSKKIVFHRENYHDKKGKENNPRLGIEYTDEDLLNYVVNIYRVLLTRGIKGTFVFVCDPALREQLGQNFDPQL
ncbi:MAG: DNA/RNA helicase domain-containing protein [Aurantimicrobium sp.]|uniref:DNA/RNA helicase domain-containing protein n=2 Tax=Aurantimicrobium sp. TaxID=1930784 RepID=UPI002FC66011